MLPGVRRWLTSIHAASGAAALLLLLSAAPARAQLVRGTITDGLSGRPVLGATVQVLNPDSSLRASTATERDGSFSMKPAPGLFVLRVERLGFATVLSKPLEMSGADTVDFEIHLPRAPIALESLNVVAAPSGKLDPSGFYKRQSWGWGRFIGPEEIKRIRPTQVGDVVTGTLGFFSYPAKGGWITRMENRGRSCTPTVYLDGVQVVKGSSPPVRAPRGGEGVQLDLLVPASQIRAVELYQDATEAPAAFHADGGPGGGICGVIVLWTYVGFGR